MQCYRHHITCYVCAFCNELISLYPFFSSPESSSLNCHRKLSTATGEVITRDGPPAECKEFYSRAEPPLLFIFFPQSFPLWKENFTFLFPSSKAHCDNSSVMLSGLLVAFLLLLEEVFKHSRSTQIIYLLVHLQALRFFQSSRALSFWQALVIPTTPHPPPQDILANTNYRETIKSMAVFIYYSTRIC